MKFFQEINDLLNNVVRPATEKDKEEIVNSIMIKFQDEKFSHSDKTEIVNRIVIRLFEQKKELRTRLLTEARELQESLQEINIPNLKQ